MREPKRTILEAVLIAAVGVGVALTANAMNRDGLQLGKDYFLKSMKPSPDLAKPPRAPQTSQSAGQESVPATQPGTAASQAAGSPADPMEGLAPEVRQKLEAFSLVPIRHAEVKELFESPFYPSGLYMIIDAREDSHYEAGHIPNAYHLFYYQEEHYANDVVPFAPSAEKIIVYCNGGDCEDSVYTAVLLRDKYMIDPARIFVYPEGFDGWKKAGLPVERGVRGSGDIVQASQPAAGGK